MAGGGASSNATRLRKRVEADTSSSSLKRARDGSAFAKCDECNKDVPIALISFHNCSLDAKIKMNLESQIVEIHSEPKKKQATEKVSKKAEPKAEKSSKKTESKASKKKAARDPNKPKRPTTAFFLFMEDFRKSFKESNPDAKGGPMVAKEGGEKWKAMSDEEKKPYTDKATELKAEYEKAMEEYNGAADDEKEADKEVEDESVEKEAKEGIDEDDEKEAKKEDDLNELEDDI